MKLIYISNSSETTKKAHGLQIAKMCEALAETGVEVELILPDRSKQVNRGNYFDFYKIKRNFKLTKLKVIDLVRFGRLGFLATAVSFGFSLRSYLRGAKMDVIYSRDPVSILFLKGLGKPLYFESHKKINGFLARSINSNVSGVIAITNGLADHFRAGGFADLKIIVAPDGVDIQAFDLNTAKDKARLTLNLPLGKKLVLYSGNLNLVWKGVAVLAKAAEFFGTDVFFILVGLGKGEKYNSKNVHYYGYKPHSEMPLWLKAADVLILPNSAGNVTSRLYTSPLRMFEYMAARRPIVASDLPSLREVLNPANACLVEPDNPEALAIGIRKIIGDSVYSASISRQAFADVQKFTWNKRAWDLIKLFKNEIHS